jgi:hypothetical protein
MRKQRWAVLTAGSLVAAGSLALAPLASTSAAPKHFKSSEDPRLGNGLGRLVDKGRTPGVRKQGSLRTDQSSLAITDNQGRVMVDLTPQQGVDRAAFRANAEARGLTVKAVDAEHGTLEGFVPLSDVKQLASLKGTGTIAQAVRPHTMVGAATSQGVALERADKVQQAGVDGKGITIGVISDSYDIANFDAFGDKLKVHAKQDIKSGDLPGVGNKAYPQPVDVLEEGFDPDLDTDEGRAMLQIVHDIAPAAKLCFATADDGQVGFANNIRALASKSGSCKADVIVDDIDYLDEPFFSDGVVGDAVDDVTAQGVQYFSAAGNEGIQQTWDSPVRLIPAAQGLKGTNLDFSGVDPTLYNGGLQDMNPGSGTDVAQNLLIGAGGSVDVQWDDPFDLDGIKLGPSMYSAKGTLTDAAPEQSFQVTAPASLVGKQMQVTADGVPSGDVDLVLSVTDPDGNVVADSIDNTTSPEIYAATVKKAGTYTITVSGFAGETGPFTLDVSPIVTPSKTTTDFNLLFFGEDGEFLGATTDENPLTGRPNELFDLEGPGEVQMVIARAGTGPMGATRLRNVMFGDIYNGEYDDPLAPGIIGHSLAKGANAVAAYDPFKPYLPEWYTSPGGSMLVKFDSSGNKYAQPQYRSKPQVAGADRGNTTFFLADDLRDPDTLPNFGGTSAAAPHVAGIAALVLQNAGGKRSLTPSAMRLRLEQSTYAHDLDPFTSQGTSGGLTLSAHGAQGEETRPNPGALSDRNFFQLRYTGNSKVTSVTLYADTASPTSLAGMVFDTRKFTGVAPFRTQGFPFAVGSTTGGLSAGTVSASFAGTGAGDSATGQFSRMKLSFAGGLKSGQGLGFGIDRDLAVSGFGGANEGNGADELGGATLLPSGQVKTNGLKYVATLANGQTITGFMTSKIGAGFSPVDGYGLVNAEKAVLGH